MITHQGIQAHHWEITIKRLMKNKICKNKPKGEGTTTRRVDMLNSRSRRRTLFT